MKTRASTFFTLVAASVAAALTSPVHAQRMGNATPFGGAAPLFGATGQLAISSDAALSIRKRNDDGTRLELVPAADYFVAPSLSVGGFVRIGYETAGDGHTSEFAIGPRVGYNIPLSDMFSFWPKAGLSFGTSTTTYRLNTGPNTFTDASTSSSGMAINLYAPFLLHPVPHFFLGFGPFIDAGLGGDARATEFGARLTIGGWL